MAVGNASTSIGDLFLKTKIEMKSVETTNPNL